MFEQLHHHAEHHHAEHQHAMFACVANDHDDRCILCQMGSLSGPTIQTYEGPRNPGP